MGYLIREDNLIKIYSPLFNKYICDSKQIVYNDSIIKAYKGPDPYIFVSYSHKDSKEVLEEIKTFQRLGYRVWYDEGIDVGEEWPDEIADALKKSDKFVVFISSNSINSKNVKNEINYARDENKDFIAIHLSKTELPPGIKMRISTIQAIFKYDLLYNNIGLYIEKLKESLGINCLDVNYNKW